MQVLSNTIKQKRKEKAGKWDVPLPKVTFLKNSTNYSIHIKIVLCKSLSNKAYLDIIRRVEEYKQPAISFVDPQQLKLMSFRSDLWQKKRCSKSFGLANGKVSIAILE